jgi:hypothetical protein
MMFNLIFQILKYDKTQFYLILIATVIHWLTLFDRKCVKYEAVYFNDKWQSQFFSCLIFTEDPYFTSRWPLDEIN